MAFPVSPRAVGVLWALMQDETLTSAEKLSTVFPECEKTLRKPLKELEDAGFIKRGKYKVNGKIRSFLQVNVTGIEFLLGKFYPVNSSGYIQGPEQYSCYNSNLSTDLLVVKEFPDGGKRQVNIGVDSVPYDFFAATSSADSSDDKIRHERQKKAEKQQQRHEKHLKDSDMEKMSLPKAAWDCSTVAVYFSHRMEMVWGIRPWQMTRTRFVAALSGMRSRLDTDGEIEYWMVESFLDSMAHEKFGSGDHAWKTFILKADSLVDKARGMVSNPEEELVAQVAADKTWEWVEE